MNICDFRSKKMALALSKAEPNGIVYGKGAMFSCALYIHLMNTPLSDWRKRKRHLRKVGDKFGLRIECDSKGDMTITHKYVGKSDGKISVHYKEVKGIPSYSRKDYATSLPYSLYIK